MRMHPPLVSCAHFRIAGACGHLHCRLSLCPTVPCPGRKGHIMKLKIRYDEAYQVLDLDEKATEQLWVSLDLDGGEELTQAEREKRIQDAFDEQFNKPEYNIWHRETRHIDPTPKRKRMDGRAGYIQASEDDPGFDIMDYLLTTDDIELHDKNFDYKRVCSWVRKVLVKKPEWADAFIAVRMDGESIRDYAARIGADENNITQKLKRAAKKLRENYPNRQI